MGFGCFTKCPRKGSNLHPLVLVIDEVASEISTAQSPTLAVGDRRKTMSTWQGGGSLLAPPYLLSAVLDTDVEFLGKGKCRRAGGNYKEGGVVIHKRLDSSLINYHIYCCHRF